MLSEGSIADVNFPYDASGATMSAEQTAIVNSDVAQCPMTCEVINHENIRATLTADGSKIEFPTDVIAGYSTGFWLKCATKDNA